MEEIQPCECGVVEDSRIVCCQEVKCISHFSWHSSSASFMKLAEGKGTRN